MNTNYYSYSITYIFIKNTILDNLKKIFYKMDNDKYNHHIKKDLKSIVYKAEELLNSANNRYKITIQVANKAKRRKYEDLDIIDDTINKPIINAIIEMVEEINQSELLNE